jgi:hypothetical protein
MITLVFESLGVYFLREFTTDEKTRRDADLDDYQLNTTFAGQKFEQLITNSARNGDSFSLIQQMLEYNRLISGS